MPTAPLQLRGSPTVRYSAAGCELQPSSVRHGCLRFQRSDHGTNRTFGTVASLPERIRKVSQRRRSNRKSIHGPDHSQVRPLVAHSTQLDPMTRKTIRQEKERQHLSAISGREMSAVTFVRDYIQLHFDGPTISAYTLPAVLVGGRLFSRASPGYRDALCTRIGTRVTAAYVEPGQRLQIDFSDGASLTISLRPEDRVVEEAADYSDAQTKEWASW